MFTTTPRTIQADPQRSALRLLQGHELRAVHGAAGSGAANSGSSSSSSSGSSSSSSSGSSSNGSNRSKKR